MQNSAVCNVNGSLLDGMSWVVWSSGWMDTQLLLLRSYCSWNIWKQNNPRKTCLMSFPFLLPLGWSFVALWLLSHFSLVICWVLLKCLWLFCLRPWWEFSFCCRSLLAGIYMHPYHQFWCNYSYVQWFISCHFFLSSILSRRSPYCSDLVRMIH